MSEIPEGLFYTEEHEYLKPTQDEGVFLVGVTDFAQGELGDVVYIELPEPGATFEKMEAFGNIEAVKAVSDLFCPVKAEILEVTPRCFEESLGCTRCLICVLAYTIESDRGITLCKHGQSRKRGDSGCPDADTDTATAS